ncbi:helix-turn-helix domain-containing protein [Actinomadura sp. LOL_016]|uniref:helix-turn-helix domain-containing protein n=2 Tax=unclassified Actinomadura TaxID=2626254 RepID=UPI003A87F55B
MGALGDLIATNLDPDPSARLAGAMRRALPAIAAEVIAEIRREVPDYAGPRCGDALELVVGCALGGFVDLVERPGDPDPSLLAFFRRVGAAEEHEGRGVAAWQHGVNVGVRVAVGHLARVLDELDAAEPAAGAPGAGHSYSEVVGDLFPYLNRLTTAAAQGRADAAGDPAGLLRRRRRDLLEALLAEPGPDRRRLALLAREARWTPPRRAAAVALPPGETAGPPPPGVLDGTHRAEPCLIVPDDPAVLDGLRRTGRRMAVGPVVDVTALGRSLVWARRTLDLAVCGAVPGDGPVMAADHVPTLVVLHHRDLVGHVARRRLRPLLELRPGRRRGYALTLQAALECGFNAAAAAERLGVHPQTVRHRLRRLDELFGAVVHDPSLHVELLMALRLWLAIGDEAFTGPA